MTEGCDLAERFNAAIRRKGIVANELFEEFDRGKRGTISYDLFNKALLSISFFINRNEINFIEKNYISNKLFDYKKFCQDISPQGSLTISSLTPSNQEILKKIARQFLYSGLNVYDYMKGFDTNHLGRVSLAVYQQAVHENPLLMECYKPYYNKSTNEVNYIQLQNDIDNIDLTENPPTISSPLPDIFPKFASQVRGRSIDLLQAFLNRDPKQHGKVTQGLFMAILGNNQLPFSHSQFQQIMIPFITSDGFVDYKLFCQEMEKSAPEKEKQTNYDFSSPLEPLLDSIRTILKNRNLHLNNQMKGKMKLERFYSILTANLIAFSPNDVAALNKAFQSQPNEIDADAFIQKVDPIIEIPPATAELTVERLKRFLTDTHQSLSLICINYDRERSKTITLNQLRSALDALRFEINSYELQQLAQQFGNGNTVFYEELYQQVEANPLTTTQLRDVFISPQTPTKTPCLDMLTKIYNWSKNYNFDYRGEFIRADSRKRGVLSTKLFRDILGSIPINMASADMCSLIENYTDPFTKNVFYPKFCDDVDSIGSTRPLPEMTFRTRNVTLKSPDSYDPKKMTIHTESDYFELPKQTSYIDSIRDTILETLKRCAAGTQVERITISDLFQYHDPYKEGFVLSRDVKAILAPIDNFLDDACYQQIIDSFKDKRRPEKFAWRKFDAAVTETTITPNELKLFTQNARLKHNLDTNMSGILNSIRGRLASRNKRVDELFINATQDTITELDFRTRLNRSGLIFDESEIILIVRKYQTSDFQSIRWKEFCFDVSNSKPFSY